MQPNDNFSIPRRPLDVEDYIDIVRRHRGWIFGPFLFCLVAAVVGVHLWPDTYVSSASVKVVPQQVPETMVQALVNQQMTERIQSMSQDILSRSTLTTIINSFGLYPRERSRMPIEDVVEEMRGKVRISPVGQLGQPGRAVPAFQVAFSYENRYQAQRVVQDLVSRFIDANTRSRSNSSFITTQFFKEQWETAKRELDDYENRLAQFRMANQGRLPDQIDSVLRQMSGMQTQIQVLTTGISRANQEKLMMQSQIETFKKQADELAKTPPMTAVIQRNEKLAEAERDMQRWEDLLVRLRQSYKENHRDVISASKQLDVARAKRDSLLKEDEKSKKEISSAPKALSPEIMREHRDLEAAIQRLQSSIAAKDVEIADYTKEINRMNDQIKLAQSRIEGAPLGEKQYMELIRDRDLAKQKYQDLDVKMSKATMAQEMEGRKQGETLELLDSASLPLNPTEPKRPLVISIGACLGLLAGIMVAGAREMKDTSLKNLKDVRAYTKLPILGSVPLLENDFVVRRRRRLAWLGWTTACLTSALIMAGAVVYYFMTKV
jgi:polysaccharide chain length determinant protein (PEP-CTERM system associated)